MLNISKIARASEWWEYKLPPMLAVAYATALTADKSLSQLAPRLGILLLGIIIGAAYVSIVNDFTDIKEDEASGKNNRLSKLQPWLRWVLVLSTVILGIAFAYFFLNDVLTIVLYSLSWIAFSLYSIPPFRLKKRGLAGVLADACGAHLFTSLFFVSATAYYFNINIHWLWFAAIGLWALMFGLRGILWHQFFDRNNDLKIGLKTFATQRDPASFQVQSLLIIITEFIAFTLMLVLLAKPLPVIAMFFYGLLLIGYSKKFGLTIITVIPLKDQRWHLLMISFYQVFLPLSLLVTSVIVERVTWIFILAHLILFPVITRNTALDIFNLFKALVKKLVF